MSEKIIKISLVSNAGLLLQIDTVKILLDAIWQQSAAYSSPPQEIQTQWLSGDRRKKWCNVDYIICTHLHNDHFEETAIIDYLKHNTVREVWFAPQDGYASDQLCNYLSTTQIRHRDISTESGQCRRFKINDQLTIAVIGTAHMGAHADESHNAILITYYDKNILLVADAEFPADTFKQVLGSVEPDAIFVNPVHFYSRRALKMITEELHAKKIVVYHTPFANEGNSVFRRMIDKKLPQVAEQIPIKLLWNKGDYLEV